MGEATGRAARPLASLFPERTLLIRSSGGMRFVRLTSGAQAAVALALGVALAWTVAATGLLAVDALRRADGADALVEIAAAYESRLAALDAERAAAETARREAEARAAAALAGLSARHDETTGALAEAAGLSAALADKAMRLSRLSAEAEAARAEAADAAAALAAAETALEVAQAERRELAATLERIALALDATAAARDDAEAAAREVETTLGAMEASAEESRAAQARLLEQIEAAAQLSIGPLEKALGAAGVDIDAAIRSLRREDDGQGGPFVPAPEVIAAFGPEGGGQVTSVMSDLERVSLLRAAVRRMPFATPVSAPRVTSRFGFRRDPIHRRAAMHEGVDFSGRHGAPIYSTAYGVVSFAGTERGYGRVVKIRHAFGFETVYGHLSRLRVAAGDRVEPGARIGDMGSTGRSTGTHLHYEIRVNGRPVDPMKFMEAARDVL